MRNVIKFCLLALAFAVLLVGCSATTPDNLEAELQTRLSLNQANIDKLYNAGLISDELRKNLSEALNSQIQRIQTLTEDALNNKNKIQSHTSYVTGTYASGLNGLGDNAEVYDLITTASDTALQELEVTLNYEVYVLRTADSEGVPFDVQAINKAVNNSDTTMLNQYFVGTGKTLWDTSNPNNQVIRETKLPSTISGYDSGTRTTAHNQIGDDLVLVTTHEEDDGDNGTITVLDGAIALRLREFNTEVIDKIVGKNGLTDNKYVVVGTRVYLMEYPVWYVDGFIANNNEFTATYKESDMRLNILTGEMMDSNGEKFESVLDVSSFIVDHISGGDVSGAYTVGEEDLTLESNYNYGRIVLRDYLELTYMPNIVQGETLVALGRRFRLDKFSGNGNIVIGHFLDNTQYEIKSYDLMDVSQGLNSGYKFKLALDMQESDTTSTEEVGTDSLSSVVTEGGSHSRILSVEQTNSINTTAKMPSSYIAIADNNGTPKPIFYGMALDVDPFSSNLFSGWINVTGETEIGSLDWWNFWLKENGYEYQVDRDAVLNYFMGNYSLDLAEEGYIVLDLNTISKIQQEYNYQDKVKSVSWITYIFTIVGYITVIYSVFIPVGWLYDVNVSIGFSLLGFLTANRCMAIIDDGEFGTSNGDKVYVTLSGSIKIAVGIMVVGLVLINIDILTIVNLIITLVGSVPSKLGNLFN